jgi:hypothetical protein
VRYTRFVWLPLDFAIAGQAAIGSKILGAVDDATNVGKQIVTAHATRSLADALKCLANEVGLWSVERERAPRCAICEPAGP